MTERKKPGPSLEKKTGTPLTPEALAKAREKILARARMRMSDPDANKGRIRTETLGQLYALTRDVAKRKEFRKDINTF